MDLVLVRVDKLILYENEKIVVELKELCKISDKIKSIDGIIILTNIRIIIKLLNLEIKEILLNCINDINLNKGNLIKNVNIKIMINNIKLYFFIKESLIYNFYDKLDEIIRNKSWNDVSLKSNFIGIGGIIKKREDSFINEQLQICRSFRDIGSLKEEVTKLVSLSKDITTKLKLKNIVLNNDELTVLRSTLQQIGINDPVLRSSYDTDYDYYINLSTELSNFISSLIKSNGGIMTLTDVYCRINRARCVNLISPNDLMQACLCLEKIKSCIFLKKFNSGLYYLTTITEVEIITNVMNCIKHYNIITSYLLSSYSNISEILSLEQLLLCESKGLLCRDDSYFGLYFYQNKFIP